MNPIDIFHKSNAWYFRKMISRKVFGVFTMVVIVEHGASCLKILSKQGKAFMKLLTCMDSRVNMSNSSVWTMDRPPKRKITWWLVIVIEEARTCLFSSSRLYKQPKEWTLTRTQSNFSHINEIVLQGACHIYCFLDPS